MEKKLSKWQRQSCPLCNRELYPIDTEYSVKYFCDCGGFERPVIEILKEGEKQDDSTN